MFITVAPNQYNALLQLRSYRAITRIITYTTVKATINVVLLMSIPHRETSLSLCYSTTYARSCRANAGHSSRTPNARQAPRSVFSQVPAAQRLAAVSSASAGCLLPGLTGGGFAGIMHARPAPIRPDLSYFPRLSLIFPDCKGADSILVQPIMPSDNRGGVLSRQW